MDKFLFPCFNDFTEFYNFFKEADESESQPGNGWISSIDQYMSSMEDDVEYPIVSVFEILSNQLI